MAGPAPLTKNAITNLCARDRPRCPSVVAAGISCWARSDSIPRTCVVSDPTSSDSLTSQFHLSNTYYKGRTTHADAYQVSFPNQLTTLEKIRCVSGSGCFSLVFSLSFFCFATSKLVRHQRRNKRKQMGKKHCILLKGCTSLEKTYMYIYIYIKTFRSEANEKEKLYMQMYMIVCIGYKCLASGRWTVCERLAQKA